MDNQGHEVDFVVKEGNKIKELYTSHLRHRTRWDRAKGDPRAPKKASETTGCKNHKVITGTTM